MEFGVFDHLSRHRAALARELRRSRMLGNSGATPLLLEIARGSLRRADTDARRCPAGERLGPIHGRYSEIGR